MRKSRKTNEHIHKIQNDCQSLYIDVDSTKTACRTTGFPNRSVNVNIMFTEEE